MRCVLFIFPMPNSILTLRQIILFYNDNTEPYIGNLATCHVHIPLQSMSL